MRIEHLICKHKQTRAVWTNLINCVQRTDFTRAFGCVTNSATKVGTLNTLKWLCTSVTGWFEADH